MVDVKQRLGVAFNLLCHAAAVGLAPEHQVEDAADQRNRHHQNNPRNLVGGVVLAGQDAQHHQKADDGEGDANPIFHGTQTHQNEQQQKQLNQDEDADDEQTTGEDFCQPFFAAAGGRAVGLNMCSQREHHLSA